MKKRKLSNLYKAGIILLSGVTLVSCSLLPSSNTSNSKTIGEIEVYFTNVPLNNEIKVGENYQLEADVLNSDNHNIIWECKNERVLSITPTGVIEGLNVGTATVYAISEEDETKSISIVISVVEANPLDDIKVSLNFVNKEIYIGETFQLIATVTGTTDNSVIWTNSDNSVATFENGIVKALKVGKTIITATSNENLKKSASCTVYVKENESKEIVVSINPISFESLGIDETQTLSATVTNYIINSGVTWSSSAASIISVEQTGIITGKSSGTAVITATSKENSSKSATISIKCVEAKNGYKLVWADNFDGTSLNEDYWNYQIGDGTQYGITGWGNSEAEYYRKENVSVSEGNLIITAKKESYGGYQYTSARIRTNGKVAKTYGRVEARIKLPKGQGLWPAFWMLPDDTSYGNWPNSGEIDIMEVRGRLLYESTSALHYATSNGNHTYQTGTYYFPDGVDITQFNVYGIEWDKNEIRWFVNDNVFFTMSMWSITGMDQSNTKPFDVNFHILLNMAVAGHFDGYRYPDDSDLPANMYVDYVKWYQ